MGRIIKEKAKPVGKQGRKATGLNDSRVARKVIRLFLLFETALHTKRDIVQKIFRLFLFLLALSVIPALCQASKIILTRASPNHTVMSGSDERVYGTSASNQITLKSDDRAELIKFPSQNNIQIQSSSDLFTVSRSGRTYHQWPENYCDFIGMSGENFTKHVVLGVPTLFLLDREGVVVKKSAMLDEVIQTIGGGISKTL